MCLICDRIGMIKRGENPYFVRELETGYVVLGDHQRFYGYTLFLYKHHEDRPSASELAEMKQKLQTELDRVLGPEEV